VATAVSPSSEGRPRPKDLRKESVEDVLRRVEIGLDVGLDRDSAVTKRRSVGARTDRGTWVRMEVRQLAKIAAQGQVANGVEAAELLSGIAKPAWYGVLSWVDAASAEVWRADEIQLVSAAPIRSRGSLRDAPALPDAWWDALNTSLDGLARQRTTRLATPDTETITQALVTNVIERAFPDTVDTTITDEEWVPAHADLNWANVTGPEFWILDWEDHGLAPRGLDAATLWISSLTVPTLAERVHHERRTDLDTRSGKLMALFNLAKIVSGAGARESPIFEPAKRLAEKLIADLR
jgi:hypothetical protein